MVLAGVCGCGDSSDHGADSAHHFITTGSRAEIGVKRREAKRREEKRREERRRADLNRVEVT